jgi:glycosyltransferase involved in cell wall biosynthesis
MLGKPVICTDWHGVEDYVKDGVNGLFVKMRDADDLRDKMVRLSEDQKLHSRLSSGARDWAERNYDIPSARMQIDNIVTELTSSHP